MPVFLKKLRLTFYVFIGIMLYTLMKFCMKMRFFIILSVFSILYSACGVEPTAQSTIAAVQDETVRRDEPVTRDEQEATPQERPKMGIATPVVLFLTSAAVAGCFFWLHKHCGGKLYRRIVRPDWGADDWRKYQDFIRTELDNLFNARNDGWSGNYSKHADDIGSETSSGYRGRRYTEEDFSSKSEETFDDDFRRMWDTIHGEGAYERDFGWKNRNSRAGQQRGRYHQRGDRQQASSHVRNGKDPYGVLGLNRNATPNEIKDKYRELAKQYHPDKNPGDKAAEEKFKEIADAVGILRKQGKVQ